MCACACVCTCVHSCTSLQILSFFNSGTVGTFLKYLDSLLSSHNMASVVTPTGGFRCERQEACGSQGRCNQLVGAGICLVTGFWHPTSSSFLEQEVLTSITCYHQGSEHIFSSAPVLLFPPPLPTAACRLHPLSQNASLCHNEILGCCAATDVWRWMGPPVLPWEGC